MKTIKYISNCVICLIKKKIFKTQITDFSQECEKAMERDEKINSIEELKLTEEYAIDYNVTTRWQTL